MDHAQHMALTLSDMNDANLAGAPIYGSQDEKIGTISHVHGAGAITQVVVDVGGFLGIGAKPVLLSIDQLNLMRDHDGNVHGVTAWTKDQLSALPEHNH